MRSYWLIFGIVGCGPKAVPELGPLVDTAPPVTTEVTVVGEPPYVVAEVAQFHGEETRGPECILEPNHAFDDPNNVWMAGEKHDPPYDAEFGPAVEPCGMFPGGDVTYDGFYGTQGTFLGIMLVPDGSYSGYSPDDFDGEIIPVEYLPLDISVALARDGQTVADLTPLVYPDPHEMQVYYDGWSHVPLLLFGRQEGLPVDFEVVGDYTWEVSVRSGDDALTSEAGFDLSVPFTVTE